MGRESSEQLHINVNKKVMKYLNKKVGKNKRFRTKTQFMREIIYTMMAADGHKI